MEDSDGIAGAADSADDGANRTWQDNLQLMETVPFSRAKGSRIGDAIA
jgi:hypothetical protein